MRQTSSVVYLAIDDLVASRGKFASGLDEFSAALDHASVPSVWLSTQTRLQLDEPRRRMHHTHPFITEDGCGVFLPEDYFHLRPQASGRRPARSTTVRLGRFTCLPIAEQQPAASDALDLLAAETGMSVVPLRSLAPRELAQNTGLPPRQADLARQRDFDELFFFAGATPQQIERFQLASRERNVQLRPRGTLWSLAIGSSTSRCVRELSKLYDRAMHAHARTVGIVTCLTEKGVSSMFDRTILLTEKDLGEQEGDHARAHSVMEVPGGSPAQWDRLLELISGQK